MNENNQPPAEKKPEMTPEQIAAAQKAGRLIYRPVPYQEGDETRIRTSDNATYLVEGKTLRRLTPKVKGKKKDRLRDRRRFSADKIKQLPGGREVIPHRSGGGEVLKLRGGQP